MTSIDLEQYIGGVSVESYGGVAGYRPWRGGPDYHVSPGIGWQFGKPSARFDDREGHIDRRRDLSVILNFIFGQGCFAVVAPVYRPQAAGQKASVSYLSERLDLTCLILRAKRQIRIVPVSTDTKSLELFALSVHVFQGQFTAFAAPLQN